MAARVRVTICMDGAILRRIDRVARSTGMSRSRWIEGQLVDAVTSEETAIQVVTDPVLGPAIMGVFADRGVVTRMVEVMKGELSSKQIELFQERLESLAGKPSKMAKHGAMKTKVQQVQQRRVK